LAAALERVQLSRKRRGSVPGSRARTVVVTGLKGGVGATAIAVNLAVALAENRPGAVALVDLGRPFPDIAKFLDRKANTGLIDLAGHGITDVDSSFISRALQPHESGIAILPGCANPEIIDPAVLDRTWSALSSMFEWIVIDLSHWIDDLYLDTLRRADQVLLLTELSIPNLENLKKWWSLYDHWNLERRKVKVVVNRYLRDNGVGLADLERVQNQPPFATLPKDYEVLSEAINQGVPLKQIMPRSKLYRRLQQLAEELTSLRPMAQSQAPVQKKNGKRRFLFF
jgi:pilus assembly protein CpaE